MVNNKHFPKCLKNTKPVDLTNIYLTKKLAAEVLVLLQLAEWPGFAHLLLAAIADSYCCLQVCVCGCTCGYAYGPSGSLSVRQVLVQGVAGSCNLYIIRCLRHSSIKILKSQPETGQVQLLWILKGIGVVY